MQDFVTTRFLHLKEWFIAAPSEWQLILRWIKRQDVWLKRLDVWLKRLHRCLTKTSRCELDLFNSNANSFLPSLFIWHVSDISDETALLNLRSRGRRVNWGWRGWRTEIHAVLTVRGRCWTQTKKTFEGFNQYYVYKKLMTNESFQLCLCEWKRL
jgi:hypothetical protein